MFRPKKNFPAHSRENTARVQGNNMAHTDGLEVRTLYRVEGPESAKVNTLINFTLFSEDDRGQLVNVDLQLLDCWLKGPAEARGKIARTGTGEYRLEFYPVTTGVYHLEVTTEGRQIFKKGDITTTITQGEPRVQERLNFELEGHGLHSGRVREPVEITIRVMDSNRRPTEIDLDSLVVEARGPSHKRGVVSSKGNGHYVAAFSVDAIGDYTVHVSYDGRSVIEQPGVKFSDKTSPSHSVITQLPRSEVQSGTAHHFRIQAKGMWCSPTANTIDNWPPFSDSRGGTVYVGGDEWEAVASGPERVNHLQITDNLDGTYTGEFILPKPGTYSFEVRLRGQGASNSPFKVKGV